MDIAAAYAASHAGSNSHAHQAWDDGDDSDVDANDLSALHVDAPSSSHKTLSSQEAKQFDSIRLSDGKRVLVKKPKRFKLVYVDGKGDPDKLRALNKKFKGTQDAIHSLNLEFDRRMHESLSASSSEQPNAEPVEVPARQQHIANRAQERAYEPKKKEPDDVVSKTQQLSTLTQSDDDSHSVSTRERIFTYCYSFDGYETNGERFFKVIMWVFSVVTLGLLPLAILTMSELYDCCK